MGRRRSSAPRVDAPSARALPPSSDGAAPRHAALAALALVVLTTVAYVPAFRADFIWDDDDYVTANATLDSTAGLARIWLSPGAVPQYYPLAFTSLWLEHQVFGDRPTGYHVTNVLLHALNAVLVWRILTGLAIPGAWLAAAIFAVHPVHVESVAWITERKNLLSGAFYLGALLAALRADASRSARGVVLACFVAALLSKTVTCTLPVVLLVLLWWRRGRVTRGDVQRLSPLFALGAVLALVTIWMERTHVGARGEAWALSAIERVLIAGRAVWFYLATLVWPNPLSFVYPRWTLDPGAWWQWLFPLAAAAALAALWSARTRIGRAPFAAAAGFVVTLAPALGFVDVYPMRYTFVADHYQYLASLFVIVPVTAGLVVAVRRFGPAAPALGPVLAAVLLTVLGSLTWRHAQVFADPETLWRDVIARDPSGSMAYINLGMWLHQHDRSTEAVGALEEARRLEPNDAEVHGNLGIVLAALGRGQEARARLEEALRLDPESAHAHNNLGNALAGESRFDEAADQYREAVRIDPHYADAQNNLANVLVRQGRVDEAMTRYAAALAIDPDYLSAHFNFAMILADAGRNDEAMAHLQAAVRLDPTFADAQRALGTQLAGRAAWPEAIEHFAAAAHLRPRQFDAHYQLASALAAAGRNDEAIVAYAHALDLQPDSADAHNDLGIAFARRGDLDAAIAEFRKATVLAPDHVEARGNLAAALAGPQPTPTP